MNSFRWSTPWMIMLLVAAIITVLDQVTKYFASEELGPGSERGPIRIIPDILELRYVENTGAAFGMFQDSTTALVFISFGVIGLLAVIFWGMISHSMFLGFAFGLQFGGAFGNLIDRVRLGYVVDFIDVPLIPVFNVADSGITVGVAILAFVILFRPEETVSPERLAQATRQSEHPLDVLRADQISESGDYDSNPPVSRDSNP